MPDQTSLIAIVIAFAIALPIILIISAVMLRAGVSLYNRLVGGKESPRAVPEPSFNKAMGIVLLVGVINWLIGTIAGLGKGFVAEAGGMNFNLNEVAAIVGSTAFGILVMAAVLKYLLPTRLARAFGVSVCHTVVTVCVAGVIMVIGFSISVAFAAM